MATGLPTVTTRVGAISDIVDEGVHAIVAEPRDVDAMVAGLVSLLTSDNLREDLGTRAQERMQSLDWLHSAEQFEKHLVNLGAEPG